MASFDYLYNWVYLVLCNVFTFSIFYFQLLFCRIIFGGFYFKIFPLQVLGSLFHFRDPFINRVWFSFYDKFVVGLVILRPFPSPEDITHDKDLTLLSNSLPVCIVRKYRKLSYLLTLREDNFVGI